MFSTSCNKEESLSSQSIPEYTRSRVQSSRGTDPLFVNLGVINERVKSYTSNSPRGFWAKVRELAILSSADLTGA